MSSTHCHGVTRPSSSTSLHAPKARIASSRANTVLETCAGALRLATVTRATLGRARGEDALRA